MTEEQRVVLGVLLTAVDEIAGAWPLIEQALRDEGLADPEGAFSALRELVYG
ncbi:MAG: hypothetical protein HQL38_03125 [Alphaproteobacteria bacterium]|nr:hypothetical protein [Alphaproteobacteria bacterium]